MVRKYNKSTKKKSSKGRVNQYRRFIISGIIFLFIIFFILWSQGFNLQGASIVSISNVQTLTGTDEMREQMLFNVVVNGGGERITGVIRESEIKRFNPEIVPRAFTVDFSLRDVSCNYRIEDTDERLFKVYQSTAIERQLNREPPFNQVNLQTTINWCENGRPGTEVPHESPGFPPQGGVCSEMVEFGEWAYWTPELTNTIIRNRMDSVQIAGDWRATHVGGIPFYNVKNIGTRAFLEYNVDVRVTNQDGETITAIVNSVNQTANLGDFGRVKIVGNLIANEFCDIPAVRYSIIENEEGMKFVDKTWVDNYLNNKRNLMKFDNDYFEFQWRQQRIDPGVGADWIFGTISGMNNALNQLSTQNRQMGCEIIDNRVVCTPETQVIYPELQLLLDTQFIGISEDMREERQRILEEIQELQQRDSQANENRIRSLQQQLNELRVDVTPVIDIPTLGKPQIQNVDFEQISANEIGIVSVNVKNIGEQQDSFDVDLTCNTDISFGSRRVSLSPNEERSVDLRFNGNAGRYQCVLNIISVNNVNNRDSTNLLITIDEKDIPQDYEQYQGSHSQAQSDSRAMLWLLVGSFMVIAVLVTVLVRRGNTQKSRKK